MFGIIHFSAYLVAVLLLVLLPGPNMLYCLSAAGQHGVKTGWIAYAGIFLGNGILIVASTFGAGTLLQASPQIAHHFLGESAKLAVFPGYYGAVYRY